MKTEFFTALLEKLPILLNKFLLPVFLLTGFILFSPTDAEWIEYFSLSIWTTHYRMYTSFIFLITLLYFLIEIGKHALALLRRLRKRIIAIRKLRNLSSSEKEILRLYVESNEISQELSLNEGETSSLASYGLIYHASNIGNTVGRHLVSQFNIHTWVMKYLRNRRFLLN